MGDAGVGKAEHGYHILADALLEWNQAPIFGLLGDGNLAPIAEAVRSGARYIASRHESSALGMATGYALTTGTTTVVTTTRGPGIANAMVGLVSAVRDHAPLVYLAGESGIGAAPAAQSLDQEAAVAPTGAAFMRVESAADLRSATGTAFRRATVERRPVVLSVPVNLVHGPAVDQAPASAPAPGDPTPTPRPDPAAIAAAWDRLRQAERPIVLAGRGVVAADAKEEVARLAAAAGALLIASLPANGLFAGDPYDLGICGGFALARTRAFLDEADLVMAFGASLNRYTLAEGSLFRSAAVIQVDRDPEAIGRTRQTELGVIGDAKEVAAALLDQARVAPRVGPGLRTPEVRERIAATALARDIPEVPGANGVDPRGVLRRIDGLLSSTRRIVVDVGHFSSFPCQTLPVTYPGQLLPAFGFGSVGLGLSTGVGVSVAHPEEPVVIVVGDGGLLMSLGELDTVARVGGRIVIVVMNDAAYGAEVHHLRHHGLPPDVAVFPMTDFAAIARAMGIEAMTIASDEDVDALPSLADRAGPMLIDAHIDPAVVSDRFKQPRPASAP